MAHIETIIENNKKYVGLIEIDNLQELFDNFDGEFKENRFVIKNSSTIMEKLYTLNLIEKGEKIAFENCDFLAFEKTFYLK